MITDIRSAEKENSTLIAVIDNQPRKFTIYEIDKKDTHISNNKLIDTVLYEPIQINAKIFAFYKEDVSESIREKIDEYTLGVELIEQGNVLITIEDEKRKYYEKKIAFRKGIIRATIPNDLELGNYTLTIQYDGNKYYSDTIYKNNFTISKRIITVKFDDFLWEAYPNQEVEIGVLFNDQLNNRPMSGVQIIYSICGTTYVTTTNYTGYATLKFKMPPIGECSEEPVACQLKIIVENNSYILEDITKYISVIKYNTYMKILSGIREQINHLQIDGYIINEEADNVKCGQILTSIDNTDIKKTFNVADGSFSDYLELFKLQEYRIDNAIGIQFFDQKNSDTITTLSINSINIEENEGNITITRDYENDHYISFKAYVEEQFNHEGAEGMVSFIIRKGTSISDKDIVYRYVTELDSEGMAYFNFRVSTCGEYNVQAIYHESFFFNGSESTIKNYKVIGCEE